MFGTLIESRAMPQRRTGSSFASILIHGAIISGGVLATGKHALVPPPEPPVERPVLFVRDVVPPAPAQHRPVTIDAPASPAPSTRTIVVPVTIPVGIPPVDFGPSTGPIEFRSGPIAPPSGGCESPCGASPIVDGRQVWNTSDVMMRLLADPVPPRYPEALRRAGVEGDVVVKFVVDTTGRIDMGSVEILKSTHDAFVAAVRETLAKLRFAPAFSGERKIRALAVMPFHFTLR